MPDLKSFVFLLISFPASSQILFAQIAASNPHGEIDPGISCNACHKTDTWTPLKEQPAFFHNMQTGFPLTGGHAITACASCHIDLEFVEPHAEPEDCGICHVDVHQGSLGQQCVDCHNTTLFQDVAGISIHAQTSFPLAGSHAQLNCINCHTDDADGAFTPLETSCISCHEDEYDNALSIDHAAAGFPVECETCHNDLQWQGALFEHLLASNGFDLVGAHGRIACASCHTTPDLTPIFSSSDDQDCASCHQNDYDDEHAGSGFPNTCTDCHNQDSWDDAVFDHATSSRGFALLGAHEALQCASCHTLPDYALLFEPEPASDQECVACHQSDYDDTHAGSGFPSTCIDCHNVNNWEASIDHDAQYFPIYSGKHQSKWANCETCHIQPNVFSVFSCEGACHHHDQANTDRDHSEVNGYVFDSVLCLSCHPDGN